MGSQVDHRRGVAVAMLIGVLLAAAGLEAIGVGFLVAADGASALTAVAAPQALLPLTLAALAAGFGGRRARIASLFGATAGLIARAASAALLIVSDGGPGPGGTAVLAAGLATGAALVGWTLYLVQSHRDLSEPRDPSEPVARSPISALAPTDRRAAPQAAAIALPQGRQGAVWATASTPWPRADEDDPDATLIRPPRK